MKIFFSVGEPSGDLHGANLVRALRQRDPGVECVGYGGPRMAAAGCQLHADLTELAVMFILRVLLNLHKFWGLHRRAGRFFRDHRPDAVVLIDYPGFNWWIARAAKANGIPVFYYGAPQMWAWAGWRITKMRRLVDHVLCKLPFEADWYNERGCEARYVGHPYYDQLTGEEPDTAFMEQYASDSRPLVAILPGSRTQEVEKNLSGFLKTAEVIARQVPDVRFAIASFNEKQAAMARQAVDESGMAIDVFVGRTPELIRLSRCCLACSGSVSLELLYHTKPSVILYTVNRWAYRIATSCFITVRFITLVNLLASANPLLPRGGRYSQQAASAEDVPFPEYLAYDDRSSQIAAHVVAWLKDEDAYRQRQSALSQLKAKFATAGASAVAADYILDHLSNGHPGDRDAEDRGLA